MIKVIIIDDEPLARQIIVEYLSHRNNIQIMQECNNGFEGIKAILQHKPDLVFLDIQMPKINGFEMLELCEQKPSIIFTTAFDEFALKAFEVNAIDYLLKPFSKERFDAALDKWLEQGRKKETSIPIQNLIKEANHHTEKNRIVVKNGAQIRIISIKEIMYFEAYDDYVKIIVSDGTFLKKQTMSHYENLLESDNFIRVHRSYLVQLNQIDKIEPFEKNNHVAVLKNGSRITLSRSGYNNLKEKLSM
ncbi:MAG TPA: LytTR family transcriptional regulator DNA-binding domain-containing protein [Bacteroidia bacterium]|nr:LytTR family transcriptional regulator DNA-binding domain-containing protein [Bacteroidia bacterium]